MIIFTAPANFASINQNEFGNRKEAKNLLIRLVKLVNFNDTVAFAMITAEADGLFNKDLYPFLHFNEWHFDCTQL